MILAAGPRDVCLETSLAAQLKGIGLFLGVGEDSDGTTDFDLNREPNKVEALIILLRILGMEAEAKVHPKTHPFTDVPSWADGYVSCAYDKGLTNGISETLFGAENKTTAEMYLTFMLRALGYSDKYSKDFNSDTPWALAAWCGIVPTQVNRTEFLRADVVNVTCAALYSCIKGTKKTLCEQLESEGVFTKEQFEKSFADDPFSEFRLIDRCVSDAIIKKEELGQVNNNTYATECHIITEIKEENDILTVSAFVCRCDMELNKNNTIGSNIGSIRPWTIELDAKTLQCKSCHTAGVLATQADWEKLSKGMIEVCQLKTQMLLNSRLIGYEQPTYDEALVKTKASLSEITKTLETEYCTIILGILGGTPHGSNAHLYLICKPDSVAGAGETVQLPMPSENGWGATSEPDNLWLGEDGKTLYYSYYFCYSYKIYTP